MKTPRVVSLKQALLDRFWLGRKRENTQIVVWLAAAALFLLLFRQDEAAPQLKGLARGPIVQLSVPWAARVEAVPVELYQTVRRGDVVALLDDDMLQAQIQTIEAEIGRLTAEHAETRGLLVTDKSNRAAQWDADGREFASDAAALAIELQQARVDLEYDRALAQGLAANVANLERLVERGHAPPADIEIARAEAHATARRVDEGERLVAAMEHRLAEAESLRERYLDRPLEEPPLHAAAAHLAQAVAVQQGLLRELEAQRSLCVLRAPFDGRIVAVRRRAGEVALERPGDGEVRRAGEVLAEGDPVVAVAAEEPTEIVAYAPERATAYRTGRDVVLVAPGSGVRAVSRITAVSPTVERLPERLWPTGVASWGRPFVVPIPSGFRIGSGDAVTVILR